MTTTDRLLRRTALATMTAGVIATTAAIAGAGFTTPALAGTNGKALASTVTRNFTLTPMPQGQLTVTTGSVRLTAYGFTPGSSHEVAVSLLGMNIRLGTLTASGGGSVSWSGSLSQLQQALGQGGLQPPAPGGGMPAAQMMILNGGAGTPAIAQTGSVSGAGTYAVHAVEPDWGVLKPGTGSITYNPAAHTLSVTVNAYGLKPGAHAAHIHAGSCRRQGSVVYALPDFTANSQGAIVHQTRTVSGVHAVKFGGGWYFNLHQGNARNITTSSGKPTVNFRPLLCSNI